MSGKTLTAGKITAFYAAIAVGWILLSDRALLVLVDRLPVLIALQTLKGIFYVAVTAGMLYLLIARLHTELKSSYIETVAALSSAIDARDSYTSDHSKTLAQWAAATAQQLGCADDTVAAVHWGALLHDIGKIGVPDSILRKPAPLTAEEWTIMKRHPVIGAEIVESMRKLSDVAPLIRAHHERYDGTGYPDGLQGEDIPVGARILAVVDAYSAIIDRRPYKEARSHEEAIAELRQCAGSQFDPDVVDAFLHTLGGEQHDV